jgi:chromosome transmission fidelity protein 18
MNVLRVSYIDPTFDRCSAAHEWLSSSDIYRSHNTSVASNNGAAKYAMEGLHIPSAAAAVHFLCRVEQRPDLTFSTRAMVDVQYQREANYALTQKFVEGLSPQAGASRCVNLLATETIPYALWVLSAGEGGGSLNRAASSLDILTKGERLSLDMHVATLRSLGLTYVAAEEEQHRKEYGAPSLAMNIRLEPPIERFVQFTDLSMSRQQKRQEIPPAVSICSYD